MDNNSNGVAQADSTAVARSVVSPDKPWTVTDGVCMELGIRLNPVQIQKVQMDSAEGRTWRKLLLEARERAEAAKKKILADLARKSEANQSLSTPQASRQAVCKKCGQNRRVVIPS